MAEFLNKDKAYSEIMQMVIKAESRLVLISPYMKLPGDFLENLKFKARQGLQTTIVCREQDLEDVDRDNLSTIANLELRFDEELNAKCFYNEKSMVITSLNLHEHGQPDKREMGFLLTPTADPELFDKALAEAAIIITMAKKASQVKTPAGNVVKAAKPVSVPPVRDTSKEARPPVRTGEKGYCIGCGKSIPRDDQNPFCDFCYGKWCVYNNPVHPEHYCHLCGKPTKTIKARPYCRDCSIRT